MNTITRRTKLSYLDDSAINLLVIDERRLFLNSSFTAILVATCFTKSWLSQRISSEFKVWKSAKLIYSYIDIFFNIRFYNKFGVEFFTEFLLFQRITRHLVKKFNYENRLGLMIAAHQLWTYSGKKELLFCTFVDFQYSFMKFYEDNAHYMYNIMLFWYFFHIYLRMLCLHTPRQRFWCDQNFSTSRYNKKSEKKWQILH